MKRYRARLAALSALTLVASLAGVIGGRPAQADPIPTTNWTPPTVTDIPAASMVATDATGGVTIGCPTSSGGTKLFKSFSAAGAVVQDQALPSGWSGSFCTGTGTVGKDGTVYVEVYSGSGRYVQAWKNNALVWQYAITCGGSVAAMTMGANGNMYMVTAWRNGCGSQNQLIGLTPTAQSGSNPPVPQVVMDHAVGAALRSNGLAAYDNGVVMYTHSGVQHAPYSGTWPSAIDPPNDLFTHVGLVDRWFEASVSGRVFLVIDAPNGQVATCTDPNSRAGSLLAIDPDGTTTTFPLNGCATVLEVHPTPSNTPAIRYSFSDVTTNGEQMRIAANGWWKQVVAPVWPSRMVMLVDLNGNIAVRNNVALYENNYVFPQIGFFVMSGVTGEIIADMSFLLRGDHSTANGPSYKWASGGEIAMARGTVYVTAHQCTNWYGSCSPTTTSKLYAFTVPGVQMDYPRGAILKHDEPWLEYVAMGDSFSSGQGVPPYESGTDTAGPPENRCMRSPKAYSGLLDGMPGPRLNLTAFVACGGSTTAHVLNGRYGEAPQVDALSASTDVVTISIGGNDIGFSELARACVEDFDCTSSSEYAHTRVQLDYYLASFLGALYYDIGSRIGPTTRVLVVGYPQMIPDPAINTLPNCAYLTQAEKIAARDIIDDLNEVIRSEVQSAGARFEYVDPNGASSPFKGRELCMDESYFHGVTLSPVSSSLHPNEPGHQAYRRVLVDYLTRHP